MKPWMIACLLALGAAFSGPASAQGANPTEVEILRDKVNADKKLVVAQNMALSEAEARVFWPVYDDYQKALDAVDDRLARLIDRYADAYNKGPVDDVIAHTLLTEMLSIEDTEIRLKHVYLPRFEAALAAARVARYYQIESKMRAAVRYHLSANIPLIE